MNWLTRLRWRHRGAWMWPTFVAFTVVDGLVGHWLPSSGDSQPLGDALISAVFLNLIVVAALARLFGMLLRRWRRDLPRGVAADYSGTTLLVLLAVVLAVAGLIHRPAILDHRRMLTEAIARAEAYIGDRAPAEFRAHMMLTDTVTIEPGIYRTCVPGGNGRTYCVVVKPALPFDRSVKFDGYESNRDFDAGMF